MYLLPYLIPVGSPLWMLKCKPSNKIILGIYVLYHLVRNLLGADGSMLLK